MSLIRFWRKDRISIEMCWTRKGNVFPICCGAMAFMLLIKNWLPIRQIPPTVRKQSISLWISFLSLLPMLRGIVRTNGIIWGKSILCCLMTRRRPTKSMLPMPVHIRIIISWKAIALIFDGKHWWRIVSFVRGCCSVVEMWTIPIRHSGDCVLSNMSIFASSRPVGTTKV